MRTIWRFALPVEDRPELEMPEGARVLAVGPCRQPSSWMTEPLDLWAEVDPDAPLETRRFFVVGTGNPLPWIARRYIGTVPAEPGLIWHVYEGGS